MYKNSFVVALSSNGKFLKDNGGTVSLPFGFEYSIFLKNLKERDASVRIHIDGRDVLGGNSLVIKANSSFSLDGFLDGSSVQNKFRFIERTEKIENHRGINPEDGLIVVTFDFEKEINDNPVYYVTYPEYYYTGNSWKGSSVSSGSSLSTGTVTSVYAQSTFTTTHPNDEGITVRGNDANQSFVNYYMGELENKPKSIILKLSGFNEKRDNRKIYVREKITCSTCGTNNKANNSFCFECGTRIKN